MITVNIPSPIANGTWVTAKITKNLPNDAVNGAIRAIRDAEMLIIGGTSLKVYPAANYISYFSGRHLVIINREKIQVLMNEDTDLTIVDSLGNVFSEIDKWMWGERIIGMD